LASALNQEHMITAVLGLTDMANAMATQEEQILEEEDKYGAMNVQVKETEGMDNIEELQQQLLNQVADVDHQITICRFMIIICFIMCHSVILWRAVCLLFFVL
jgi:hypothetical protein